MKAIYFFSFFFLLFSCTKVEETPPTTTTSSDPPPVYLTPDIMCGTVQFEDGCGQAVDSLIRFGLALIHHMTYDDAEMVFQQVIDQDPDCFWGHWGKAMTFIHPLWPDQPSEDKLKRGLALALRANGLAQKENEKMYGQALAAYYENGLGKTEKERLASFHESWKQVHENREDDLEAQAFYALTCLATVSPSDKTYDVQKKAGALAEKILETIPDHPGGFHYAIHAYDFPPLANMAVRVASNYSKIAPDIPHALHMPTHIFTRLGYWAESIEMNGRSAKAAWRSPAGDNISLHYMHALDYMVHAHLQMAETEAASKIYEDMNKLEGPFQVHAGSAYAFAAIPGRLAIENRDWEKAAAVDVMHRSNFPWKKFPQFEALTHFAKGIGAGRSGQAKVAQKAFDKLGQLQEMLGKTPATSYWYNQMEIQKTAVLAWQQYAEGKKDEALATMTLAADMESRTEKNPITPGEVIQVREMLGDLYLEMDQPAEALAAYEAALEHSPKRFNVLYGAGRAAELVGEADKAKTYFSKMIEQKGAQASKNQQLAYAQKAM